MGLGCILCRKPLVNYVTLRRINWAKANGVNGRTKQECPSFHDDQQNQHKNNQVVVSTCGHLFHKQCLKSFFTNGNTKKSYSSTHKLCPYCNNCFQLEKCFPVYLKPESDSTGSEMKRLIFDNNKLQQNLITLKKLVKKREAQLESIVVEIEQIETGGGDGTSSQDQNRDQQDRVLESEEEEMLKNVSAYSNLNQRLVSMIQESMKMEDAIWNPNTTDGSQLGAYNYSPLYKRPGTPKFQSGQFFNADALRTQYASYNNLNIMNGNNSKLEPEGPYPNYNSGMGNSGPFPNPNVELNYFHQLESMPGTGEYQIVQNPSHHRNMPSFEPKHKQAQAATPYDSNSNGASYLGARPDPYKPLLSMQKQIQNRFFNVSNYNDSTTNHSSPAIPPKSRVPPIKDPQRPAFLKEMPSVHNYNYY